MSTLWLRPDTCRLFPGLLPPPSLRSSQHRRPPQVRRRTYLSTGRPGLLLLLERRGGSSRRGERPPLFQDWSSLGPLLDMGASLVGMLMPAPLEGGAISWDCQAESGDEQRKGWKRSQVV